MTLMARDSEGSETTEVNDLFGIIESPRFSDSDSYEDFLDVAWQINAPENYQVVVYFTVFDLEDCYDEDFGGACAYDYVQVMQTN